MEATAPLPDQGLYIIVPSKNVINGEKKDMETWRNALGVLTGENQRAECEDEERALFVSTNEGGEAL